MNKRHFADLNNLRAHDIVAISLRDKTLFFFAGHEGHLKFKHFSNGREAFSSFFSHCGKEKIKDFLREKAEGSGLKMSVFDETDDILDVSFRK